VSDRKPYVGGNWKMFTNKTTGAELTRGVADGLLRLTGCDVAIFPPFPYLLGTKSILRDRGSSIRLGAQDVYSHPDGAFTGEVSVAMLADCGVQVVLCGHSERRHVIKEPDELVNAKLHAVLEGGLEPILCIGETLEERTKGRTDEVTERQLRAGLAEITADAAARVVIAYEPVWAIGTGKTATPADVQDVHAKVRALVAGMYSSELAQRMRIMYGGSLKPANASEIFAQPDVDGGLVGGASLKTGDFVAIARAAAAARPM
jgi:triosephosphate isomerase